jgi:3-oxoacyl-[acyl-carrier protein] reductase
MGTPPKNALVTGSSSGVGRATALALAAQGVNVAINYSRSAGAAEAVAAEVERLGVKVICERADVARDADCKRLVAAAEAAFGGLDVLVNNAGTTRFVAHHELDKLEEEDWRSVMAVNVQGPFQMARAARSTLAAGEGGCIVNVGSIAGLRAMGSSIAYCASKAALHNLTLSLARVLGPQIRVNAVAPGFIEGEWLMQGLGADAYAQVKRYNEQRSALQAVCKPEDVADAILSLINGSRLVTGQVLPVEAGLMLAI